MDTSEEQSMAPSIKRANKRLKVGRACYTCRAKKIKCDGLRPCMQCKARQRPCSFYKDGSLETDQDPQTQIDESNDRNDPNINDMDRSDQNRSTIALSSTPTVLPNNPATITTKAIAISAATPDTTNAEESILFAETSTVNHNKLKRRGPLMESRISNTLGSLGENMRKLTSASSSRLAEKLLNSTESFGSFIMWMPEPSLPSRYSGSIEMPSREIQMALIDQFFNEKHESLNLIIRFYFYEQLETKGLLITPLLLNIIYAHAARFVTIPGCPKTEVFYHRARRLVDDFMDVPRVSTVIALCLLSLYEPSPAIYRPGSHHCRQWQYSGMACRMTIELGLYDDSNVHSSLTPVEIELRRRVFWGCYDLDKFQSSGWERPWMISREISRTSLPSLLPEESENDAQVLEVLTSKIRYVNIVEENLILSTASQAFLGGNNGSDVFLGMHKDNLLASIDENHAKHQNWMRTLRPNIQWTPISTISVKDVLDLPAPRPMVGHLHLYYNTLCLALLDKLPNTSVSQFQARVTAACMTQLCHHLCQTPSYIIKFDFIAHALISAIKVHIRYLDDPDVNLAQQAWLLFDRSICCMQLITSYAVIPNCMKFLQQVQNIYGLHLSDSNNYSSSNSPSPTNAKKHQRSASYLGHTSSDAIPPSSTSIERHQRQKSMSTINVDQNSTQQSSDLSLNSTSSSNKILDSVQFPDDISQILTDWSSTTSTSNNEHNNSILQLDSNSSRNNNNMIYLNAQQQSNTQMHPQQYHQFNSPPTTRHPQQTLPPKQRQHHQHQGYPPNTTNANSYSNNPLQHHHQRSNSANQLPIWNTTAADPRYGGTNDPLSYNSRDIVVPSQLSEDNNNVSSTSSDNNNPAIMFQQHQQQQQQPRYTPQNEWQPQHQNIADNNGDTAQDDDTPVGARGLGAIYMSSRQHYEDMIKRPHQQQPQ